MGVPFGEWVRQRGHEMPVCPICGLTANCGFLAHLFAEHGWEIPEDDPCICGWKPPSYDHVHFWYEHLEHSADPIACIQLTYAVKVLEKMG